MKGIILKSVCVVLHAVFKEGVRSELMFGGGWDAGCDGILVGYEEVGGVGDDGGRAVEAELF